MKHPFLLFIRSLIFISAAVSAVLFSAGAVAQKRLLIATGSTSGVYYPFGGAVAKVISVSVPDVAAAHQETSGSAENVRMVADRKADIGFTQADVAWDGYKGYGKFSSPQSIRAIAVLYPERLQVLVPRDSGIIKIGDLRGKRVATGASGSGTEIWANRLLTAHGLNPNTDIQRHSLSLTDSAVALKDGKVDALIWAGGVPTKAIADLAQELGPKLRMLETASAVQNMLRMHGPVYTDGEIPPLTYTAQSRPVKTAEVWTLLVVREDMDPKLVYDIVKSLFEQRAELLSGHVQARNVDLVNQGRGGSPIPFHPGAKKYYTEKGIRILH